MAGLVSVIMPAYNVAPFVGEAIGSALAQDWPRIEVIVADDGSTDETAAIAGSLAEATAGARREVRLVPGRHGGAGAARNAALDVARGETVVFLDADDRLRGDAVGRLSRALAEAPNLDMVFPFCRHIDESGRPTGVVSHTQRQRLAAQDLVDDNPIHSGSGVTVRRRRIEATGRFDTTLPGCIDMEFWVRLTLGRGETIGAVAEPLVDYRRRSGQITGDWRRMRRGWEAVLTTLDRAGHPLPARRRRRALARNLAVWATLAYQAGRYADARRLVAEMWRTDPAFAATDGHARIRSAACLTSLLPAPLHDRLRDYVNRG